MKATRRQRQSKVAKRLSKGALSQSIWVNWLFEDVKFKRKNSTYIGENKDYKWTSDIKTKKRLMFEAKA